MSEVILGADPGLSGALAVVKDGRLEAVEDMPTFELQIGGQNRRRINGFTLENRIRNLLADHTGPLDDLYIVLEDVGPRPKDGTVGSFTFGEGYGLLQGVIMGLRLPVRYVKPNIWKRDLKLRKGKDASRQRAMELFPDHRDSFARVKDDGRAEAALIAHWARAEIHKRGTL